MRYQSVNRVYQIEIAGGDSCLYIAATPTDAMNAHLRRIGPAKKKRRRTTKPIEVPAGRIITVGFDDCAEAIAHVTGTNPDAIRPSMQGIPLADEFIAIRRAAEQWARMVAPGKSRFLWTSVSQ